MIDLSNAAGRKILGILDYETPWIYPGAKSRSYIPPGARTAFLNYVKTTAARYKGRIGAWEIWNEPNAFWFWDGPEQDFFALAEQTAAIIREVDPDVPILTGATWGVPGPWLRGLYRAGGFRNANAYFGLELPSAATL